MDNPLLYVVLGTAGAGRRRVIADLVRDGLDDSEGVLLLTSNNECAAPPEVAEVLEHFGNLTISTWAMDEAGKLQISVPDGVSEVFFVSDGRSNPVDQIEMIHDWLPSSGVELARILTVFDCSLAVEQPLVQKWYDACIHFSDVLILGRRENVSNKWISDFTARLKKEHFPFLVEMVRKKGFPNAPALLEPQARRISLYFDDPDDWPEIDEEEIAAVAGETNDLLGKEDPYIERTAADRRVRELPDVGKLLKA